MLKIWPQVKVMTWPEKVMLHISRSVSSAWTQLWYFHRSSWSLSKVIAEKLLVTFYGLKWPWGLATWRRVTGHNILTQVVKYTLNPIFERVLNDFRPKEAPFMFLLLTYNGEVAKLTWPWVAHIKIPRYTFHRYWYGYPSLKVSRQSFSRCSFDKQTLYRWGHLTWPGDLTLRDLDLKFSQHMQKRCMNRYTKNGGALDIRVKPDGGRKNAPSTARANNTSLHL